EAIDHAKSAGVPIIVAINKMDAPGANPSHVTEQLMKYNLIPEDYGGDTIFVKISAKTGDNVEELLQMILLQADVLELKADP
ncbi:GTP-binding protein, partial [Lactobacillus mulieris]